MVFGVLAAEAEPAACRLGPEDRLQVKVFDWRTGSGEAYQWQALNGEFTVGADGAVSLPLLGGVPALDLTPSALAEAIGQRLQARIGLAQRPEASVQVVKYRPFYVVGSVERPGEYDYRPDLSVLQAVSIAGGLGRSRMDGNALGFERQALEGRGDLRALSAERTELLIRQARLDAEIAERDVFTVPPDLQARQGEPAVARALREEQALFETRREALRSQTETLTQSRALLERQIGALAAKDVSLAHQLSVTRQELDQIAGLVSSGLAVLPRKLAIEENAAQYESSRLDVQLATLRAQQDISKAMRDMADIRAKERNDALLEASQVRGRLGDVTQKLETVRGLVFQAEVHGPAVMAAAGPARPVPTYAVTRKVDGHPTTLDVGEGDLVLPGDVVRVEMADPAQGEGASLVGIARRADAD
ncbi:polysaccharide biosynthesis/export family protein [Lichenihabitans sp. Uapishka_5]|uniref:polysaccharide biosynthesis/export family protein n=1 Tax=Lichenihabitans sp. Uapishka_5 TaxID=3037302 RepID=UPI0029E81E17|nr:polysaccharide biosynthesis/export family protein [Lichenihabitans sp. Uapishka_5]MDX7950395.1 polysaccharide biosynthesis/export family protein [Lichenihabitans sp. Uapishka_5]